MDKTQYCEACETAAKRVIQLEEENATLCQEVERLKYTVKDLARVVHDVLNLTIG